jgi:hypothetical protein
MLHCEIQIVIFQQLLNFCIIPHGLMLLNRRLVKILFAEKGRMRPDTLFFYFSPSISPIQGKWFFAAFY